jgi:hypothetical protein
MPQHVTLSNGHRLDIPDGTPPEEVKRRAAIMEGLINPQWKGFGNLSDAGETIRNVLSYVNNPAGRIAAAGLNLNPVVGGYDLGASGLNALKAVASRYYPSARNVPDLPIASDVAGSLAGVTPLSPNASPVQRYAEAAATGLANPKQAVRTGLEMLGATGAGDAGGSIASYYGGPDWGQFGRWLGSLAGAGSARALNPVRSLSGPQAPSVATSAANIDVAPTFGSQANSVGRGLERGFGALPLVNIPIVRAQTRMEEGIQAANADAATKINLGSPPASDVYSIGKNLIAAARAKSAAIKADAGQQFENLYNQLPAGNSTLVDATPVLNAIKAQANSPNVSGQQKADLMDRYNYLQSMTYGQPGYNGPRFQGVTPVNAIPIGQIARFRSELGDDLNTMRGIDATAQGPARDAVTAAMQNTFNRAGLGPQFKAVNDNYSRNIGPGTPTATLDTIGGKPIRGKPGLYEGGMDEGGAFNYLNSNLQSPSSIEPLVDPSNPHWRAASSGFIGSLGARSGQFSAVDYGRQVGDGSSGAGHRAGISDPVLEQFTRGQPDVAKAIRDAANVGSNASPIGHAGPTSTTGLLGAEWLMDQLGGHFSPIVAPLVAAGLGAGAESRPFTSAMTQTGGSTPLVDALYTVAPTAYALNDPDDPRNQPVTQSRPPSPLDKLNPPPPGNPLQPAYSP